MEENSENKPKEPKAKPKAKASGRKLQSKKGKEAQPALTSIIGNGEQPDREQGNQEITEVEASSENLNKDADNEALQLNITEDQSLSPPSHTIMRPKRPKEENLNRLRKLIKKLEDLEPRTTGPYFENEDDPELEPGNNDEAELETDEDQEDNEAYEDHERQTAAELFLKGGTERFRSLSSRDEKEVRMALCCMFYLRAELTLRRTSEFLIFLLGKARLRLEEDLEEGERLASMHGKVQQTAIVLVEKLRENDQEMLWCTKAGVCILVQFQLGDARLFFARPSLQQIMLDMWQGVRPDYFERNWCQQLRVWMRLLLFGSANLVMVPLFAVAPGVESYLQCKVILRADQTRQEEEDRWKRILKKQNNQWPYRFEKKGKVCWDKEDFEKAVREECREQVFQVQSRMPLLIPRYKKYLAILTNLGFAAYLIAERPEGANVPVVLVLSAGAWLGEVAQLVSFANAKAGARNSFLFWFMDRVNVMELVAFTCIAWTTVLVLIDKQSVEFAQQFKALGVLFLGISQFMAMLRMSSVFGPLVSMTMNMIVDMIQWVALLFPMIACVVAALVTLFKTRSKSCVPFGFDYLKGVVRFFEAQIGGEMLQDSLECLRGAESPAQFTGPLIMMLGMWMIMILMLNMLIAMMAKTFDRIYESAMVDFQYHFIGNLLQMIEEPAVPPILRTLGVPWRICSTCWWWIYQRGSKLSEKIGTTQKAQQKVKLRESSFHDMQKELQEREDKEADILKAMKLRFLDKNLTHEDCIKMLYAFVTEFISEHASDTQVQDDLWRKQMAQKLFLMDIKLETKVDTLRTQLDEMSKNMKSIEQSLQKLTGNSADSSLQSKPDVEGVQKDTTSWG